jgi:two-component system, OmpR family, alkaline phosphatase synthesis response regulator PhoP
MSCLRFSREPKASELMLIPYDIISLRFNSRKEIGSTMSKRILLCDDEIHILRATEFKLKKAGYDVEIASDGEDAWQSIQNQKPDLLITDCQMPRMTGLELIGRLRSDPQTANLPIFMLTAKGYELTFDLLYKELHVLRVIAKPFSPRELLQDVNEILQVVAEKV